MIPGAAQIYRNNAQRWVAPAPTGTGITIYVATTGNNSNNGLSLGAAKATIHGADLIATPGSVIRVQPGSYVTGSAATYQVAAAGTVSNRIVYWSESLHGAKLIPDTTSNSETMMVKLTGGYQDFMGFDLSAPNATTANGNPLHWGIYAYAANPVSIQYNYVHDFLTNLTELNIANTNGSGGSAIDLDNSIGMSGILCNGNIVANIGGTAGAPPVSSPEVHSIYMIAAGTYSNNLVYIVCDGMTSYHGMTSCVVLNNTIDRCANIGILIDSATGDGNNCRVFNNVITNGSRGIIEAGVTGLNNIYNNNTIFNMSSTAIALQHGLTAANTLTSDPLYANATALNYHLKSSSPSYQTGTSTSPTTATDLLGFTRTGTWNRGCYQDK